MKIKRIAAIVFAAASLVALNGCSASCEDACDKVVERCEREIIEGRSDIETERTACLDGCRASEEAPEKCDNLDEVKDCLVEAETCTAIGACPPCAAE